MGIDWFRATGPAGAKESIRQLLDGVFGDDGQPRGGRYNFREGHQWASTAAVFWTHTSKDRCRLGHDPRTGEVIHGDGSHLMCVDLPGGALGLLSADERVELMARILMLGFRATRCDVFLDVVGEGADGLIDQAWESCQDGELCGARRFRPISDRKRTMGGPRFREESPRLKLESDHRLKRGLVETCGKGLSIGRRGKEGSGRFIRLYDKGLETGQAAEGEWVRVEVEFTGDCAADAALAIAKAFGDDDDDDGSPRWLSTAAGVLLGSIDFRENNGQRELSRRKRSAWWARLVEGVELQRVKAGQVEKTLRAKLKWYRDAALPWLDARAEELGLTLQALVVLLFGDDRRLGVGDLAACQLRARLQGV